MSTPLLARLKQIWFRLRYSYWFIPALMMLGSIGLSFLLVRVDHAYPTSPEASLSWNYAGGPDGAREVLSAIAGSMITVAGVVFSITVVALQLASSQFGPRVLRNFMRDRGNQVVLGTFVSTFVYSLLVLRTIEGENGGLVPALSVTVAVVLALLSLAVLIYYIHHTATSIQASHIVKAIGTEFMETVSRIHPEPADPDESDVRPTEDRSGPLNASADAGMEVALNRSGYIQGIDLSLLIRTACEHDLVIRLTCRPGTFVTEESIAMTLHGRAQLDDDLLDEIRDAVVTGSVRTHEQDVLFAAEQLVEVAVRSLSPSLNDPFTAMTCIDWIKSGLVRRMQLAEVSPHHRDEEGTLRVVIPPVSFDELLDVTFGRIRPYAEGHPMVLLALLESLEHAVQHARTDPQRETLLRHVRLLRAASHRSIEEADDLQRLEERAVQLLRR